MAPAYRVPQTAPVTAYKEEGGWTAGTPQDALPRGEWWAVYSDTTLDDLEARIDSDNPTLAQAMARYDAARAYLVEVGAEALPTIGIDGHADTDRQSANRPLRSANQPTYYGDDALYASISWDLDLWGRVRSAVAAGRADAQATAADLQSIRLSLQAQLASDYFAMRGLDAEATLLRNTIAIYQKALDATDARHDTGISSGLDVDRAQSHLKDAQAQLSDVLGRRALLEHAIATLTGQPASNMTITPATVSFRVPNVPPALPSTLLQRRPDVAAAERRVAAANQDIGVARAAFYPDLDLAALGGFQNTGNGDLFTQPNSVWAVGPSLALTVFDAGKHKAELEVAKAGETAAAAAYRASVLRAFQEVEDNLALLNHLSDEANSEDASAKAALHSQDMALTLYKNGALGFLDVVVAQTTELQAQQAALSIETRRLQASVGLIQATGGGWSAGDLPAATSRSK
jgi:NodT family efflux transporter outer membrane factor (OMF) lipoprotein